MRPMSLPDSVNARWLSARCSVWVAKNTNRVCLTPLPSVSRANFMRLSTASNSPSRFSKSYRLTSRPLPLISSKNALVLSSVGDPGRHDHTSPARRSLKSQERLGEQSVCVHISNGGEREAPSRSDKHADRLSLPLRRHELHP